MRGGWLPWWSGFDFGGAKRKGKKGKKPLVDMVHGTRNLRNIRRGTSNDPSTLHQSAASSCKNATPLPLAAMIVMEGKSTEIGMCPSAFFASSLASLNDLWADSTSQSLQRSGVIWLLKARSSLVPSSALSLQARTWFQRRLVAFQACVFPSISP